MNLIKYMLNRKYRDKYRTEFSGELVDRSDYEIGERKKLLEEASKKNVLKKADHEP